MLLHSTTFASGFAAGGGLLYCVLLAREIGVRGSLDIDVYRNMAREKAEADLRTAASADIGDWFRFELGEKQIIESGTKGARIPVVAAGAA